jgi:hypothetical protein
MPIAFTCPHCGHQTDVPDEYAGQAGPCVECGKTVTVPLPGQAGYGTASPSSLPRLRPSNLSGPMLALAGAAVLCCCGGVVLAPILVPIVQARLENDRRVACAGQLRQIGVAMQLYHQQYGSFPPPYTVDDSGRPMHSWRALLLPYVKAPQVASRYRFDEPWDSAHNQTLRSAMPAVYACPSDHASSGSETDYVVIVGPGGVFDPGKTTSLAEIKDGLANTLLVAEVVGSGINWLEPRDLPTVSLAGTVNSPRGEEVSSNHPGGAHVLTADGKSHFLPDDLPPADLHALTTIAGGEFVNLP